MLLPHRHANGSVNDRGMYTTMIYFIIIIDERVEKTEIISWREKARSEKGKMREKEEMMKRKRARREEDT